MYQFLKTLLAFNMPKGSTLITNIGVLNAQQQGVLNVKKEVFKTPLFWCFKSQMKCLKSQKWCLSFMKRTPGQHVLNQLWRFSMNVYKIKQ